MESYDLFGRVQEPAADPVVARILTLLAKCGLQFHRVVFTRNRRVMASIADRGAAIRLHEAFRNAPDEVIRALGRLFAPGPTAARTAARETIRTFLETVPPQTTARPRPRKVRHSPADQPHLERLRREFDAVNAEFFEGALPRVPLRLSGRMRRRNGHFSTDPLEIAISRRLCVLGAEGESECTLRHEMIHLQQFIEGRKPGHGRDFRHWARILGIPPRASRTVCWTDS